MSRCCRACSLRADLFLTPFLTLRCGSWSWRLSCTVVRGKARERNASFRPLTVALFCPSLLLPFIIVFLIFAERCQRGPLPKQRTDHRCLSGFSASLFSFFGFAFKILMPVMNYDWALRFMVFFASAPDLTRILLLATSYWSTFWPRRTGTPAAVLVNDPDLYALCPFNLFP